jgi:hypothetical protein
VDNDHRFFDFNMKHNSRDNLEYFKKKETNLDLSLGQHIYFKRGKKKNSFQPRYQKIIII